MAFRIARCLCVGVAVIAAVGCSAGTNDGLGGSGGSSGTTQGQGGANGSTGAFGTGSGGGCALQCTTDLHAVIDCNGNVISACSGAEGCDLATGTCQNACQSAETNKLSVGCDYYATAMDQIFPDVCFAAFVANTWNTPVHIQADFNGAAINVAGIARIPSGSGAAIQYNPYDSAAGLPPGQVAILFLAGGSGSVACPIAAAVPTGAQLTSTDIGHSFHIQTDVPVVTYQINPYGGGSAQTTAASLLLPTSVWDTNYVAVNITAFDIANPSLNIVARDDNTTVTILPKQAVDGGGAVPPMPANQPTSVVMMHGENMQISQQAELTGSIIQSDKPIGFMAGQNCMRAPIGTPYCDHGEQMIPPVKALGSEYAGVMYRPRVPGETQTIWKLIGAVNGTQLTWTSPVGGPATLDQGQVVEFDTGTPFVVKSQDAAHPFILMTYMSSNGWVPGMDGYGDPDLVMSVPPAQYLNRYVFFADPTYPESDLVVIRAKDGKGMFDDVTLDCAGVLTGWQPVGDYEWTRIDLQTGDFQPVGNCSTGAHEMKSDGRFGLWVWGWGTPETTISTRDVSYGYPGGMNALPINQVVIPPIPN
jgi:IgGFc binding protein